MNTIILSLCTIVIITTHLFAINLLNKEETPPKVVKPQYQKISMQFAQIIPAEKAMKQIEKPKVIKKEKFIKPIKKNAKREFVKKKKTVVKKKVIKKKIAKKVVKKTVIQKKIVKAPVKKVKKTAPKETTQSLEKYIKVKQNYVTQLRSAIDKNKKYPRISRKLKEQGKVTISFRVLENGEFKNIKIFKKSLKHRLNTAALNAVLLTKNFKQFPKELKSKKFLDLALPINFKLH